MATMKTDKRTRNWAFIVYSDSAPSNWRDILDEYHVEWVESPLHDKDVNPDGEPKKPHYHCVICFGGLKSWEQVCELIHPLNCSYAQRVNNLKSTVRYFCHLDNPEKYQYPLSGIIGHGGIDIDSVFKISVRERYLIIRDICQEIRLRGYTSMMEVMDIAMTDHFDDWWPLLCDNSAYIISQYIKSYSKDSRGEYDD